MPQTILYARVSSAEQTLDHQHEQATKEGFQIDDVIADHGVSGVSIPFADREGAKRLSDRLRRGDTLVVRWVDRLGRDYDDVTATIRAFMAKGVTIKTVLNRFTFDGATDDPVQKAVRDALIAFMAATAQAQAEATKAAQRAGIDHAKAGVDAGRKYRGKKPTFNRKTFEWVRGMLASPSHNISAIARDAGISRQTVLRIKADPATAEAALTRWGL